ncbi:hypothetical protein [Thomasclavelia cocleata]|uniref:hypothetical protein n=1 Tax=Thomasclavelia cocleata TaxID=69824 RepID=UPI00258B071E|nr:hypothetical protein [Thomasclavelia cocleata]
MQDFKKEKKMLKYWYCTFSTLHQVLTEELQYRTNRYLIYIQDTLKKLNSNDPTLDYQFIIGCYKLNLTVFNNFLKLILKSSCIFSKNKI